MQVIILCGGKGRRMGSAELPKALFPIGAKPILWHIMNIYAYYGFCDFILSVGYKGQRIKASFAHRQPWDVTFVDTGLDTNTGGRIAKLKKYIKEDCFFATYGDGLADINLRQLLDFHKRHKKIATLTAVRPYSAFGIVGINAQTQNVTHFEEKPRLDHWINGGFFVFNKEIFDYLRESDILEKDTFGRILKDKQICAFKHQGFWKCMDTYKDNLELNDLWRQGKAQWRRW